MTESRRQCVLVGLPGAGKTTFLAALWHQVESAEIDGGMRLVKLDGDREYITDLVQQWLECRELPRTPTRNQESVRMLLRDRDGDGEVLDLSIPDLSGEDFKAQWIDRICTPEYRDLARAADGVLLFIHPDKVVPSETIEDANALIRAAGGDASASEGSAASPAPVEWSPEFAPTQVILVELLQFIQHIRPATTRLNLGIVISAWDLVERQDFTPRDWLRGNLPLLNQYLDSQSPRWSTTVYGVSAQGGDLTKDRDALLGLGHPSQRVHVVEDRTTGADLTVPLRHVVFTHEVVAR